MAIPLPPGRKGFIKELLPWMLGARADVVRLILSRTSLPGACIARLLSSLVMNKGHLTHLNGLSAHQNKRITWIKRFYVYVIDDDGACVYP